MTHQIQPNHPHTLAARGLGIALGLIADAALGDPRRGHPVAAFGRYATQIEKVTWRDSTAAGALHWAACVLPVTALGIGVERWASRRWWTQALATAVATWAALGARSLVAEGLAMSARLAADDLDGAREQLPHLCGRVPDDLDEPELARATAESLAENCSDAVVATLFWGALAGVPGVLAHRAINTMDAMVGHLSPRYRHFGTVSARLDDAANYVPARLTGALACALAGTVGGSPRRAWRIMRRDARDHPSPNGGWCEAAWAGALGVQLGGRNVYGSRIEERGLLGDGPRPDASAVRRASGLVAAVTGAAGALAVASTWLRGRR